MDPAELMLLILFVGLINGCGVELPLFTFTTPEPGVLNPEGDVPNPGDGVTGVILLGGVPALPHGTLGMTGLDMLLKGYCGLDIGDEKYPPLG